MNKISLFLLSIMLCLGFARANETWMFMEEYPWVWSSERDTWVYAVTNEGQLLGYYLDTEAWEDIGVSEEVETNQKDVNRIIDFYRIMYWQQGESTDLILVMSEVNDGVKTEFLRVDLTEDASENGLHGLRWVFDNPNQIEWFLIDDDRHAISYLDLPNPPVGGPLVYDTEGYSDPREFNTEYPLFGYENYVVEIIDASDHSGFNLSLSIGE